jgi:hypothetical protein
MPDLEFVVVILSSRPKLHFLYLDIVLLLPRFPGRPLLLVSELPVVHQLHYGWPRLRCDLDHIHPALSRPLAGFLNRNNADLATVGVDQPYRADPDLVVDADPLLSDVRLLQLSPASSPGLSAERGPQKKPGFLRATRVLPAKEFSVLAQRYLTTRQPRVGAEGWSLGSRGSLQVFTSIRTTEKLAKSRRRVKPEYESSPTMDRIPLTV